MAVGSQMEFVLRLALDIHVAGIPIAIADGGRRTPMCPDAELRISKPFRAGVPLECALTGGEGPGLNDDARLRSRLGRSRKTTLRIQGGPTRCPNQVSARPIHDDSSNVNRGYGNSFGAKSFRSRRQVCHS